MKLTFLLILAIAIVHATAWSLPFHTHSPEYNSWDDNKLAQWLRDNRVKHSSGYSRTDLLDQVQKNWNYGAGTIGPFASWSNERLRLFLSNNGIPVKSSKEDNRDWLLSSVKKIWTDGPEPESKVTETKQWIFNMWSESALKKFLDENDIKSSAFATKDSLLEMVQANYDSLVSKLPTWKKSSDSSVYDWLFDAWTDSDLREWLVSHGYAMPKETDSRSTLIDLIRQHSYEATQSARHTSSQFSFQKLYEDMFDVFGSLRDHAFDSWSSTSLKSWLTSKGIDSSRVYTKEELIELASKYQDWLKSDIESSSQSLKESLVNTFGIHRELSSVSTKMFRDLTDTWSESALREFLQARGIVAPDNTPLVRLKELVWSNRNKMVSYWDSFYLRTQNSDNLKSWLKLNKQQSQGNHDSLYCQSTHWLEELRKSDLPKYKEAIEQLQSLYVSSKESMFDTWKDSEIRDYLKSFGEVKMPSNTPRSDLVATAKRNAEAFLHGANMDFLADKFAKA
ncbi:uncharacterized protein V1516DRAFT_118092 [Lipomyces oligophaga]|uniref:uncharacterized protein n=1 Tax=Lipomyces oligophaga TaxID=45792 RepID=UPI0034CE5B01